MMPGIRFEVKVSPALGERLRVLSKMRAGLNAEVGRVVRDSAFAVLADAKSMVPVSTGALRRSLTPTFMANGWAALIGSWLPYAARQEYDMRLDHTQRPPRRRVRNTIAGKPGSVIKGTGQSNPNAQWGFLRKALNNERENFLASLRAIARHFGEAWSHGT